MDEVMFSTAYQARKKRVACLIKKFVQWKILPSRGRVTKKDVCFAFKIPKSVPKLLTFNAVNNMKVAICTACFSTTNNAFFSQSAFTYFLGF